MEKRKEKKGEGEHPIRLYYTPAGKERKVGVPFNTNTTKSPETKKQERGCRRATSRQLHIPNIPPLEKFEKTKKCAR